MSAVTKQITRETLACPFCPEGRAVEIRDIFTRHIECEQCGARGPVRLWDGVESLEQAWDTRNEAPIENP